MIFIPKQVVTALTMLSEAGFESYIVGGCVRDQLLNRTPNDYDITTNALPEQTQEIFREFKCINVGAQHGTVAVIIDKMQIEITTYRIDGEYNDNRHPDSVTFSSKIQDDLSRRDFTVNAMACSKDGDIVDCFNGKSDLENRIIRCVGEPDKRFGEDALRIMRAVRFASQLDFEIEPETEKYLFSLKDTLKHISAERLRVELDKLLCGKAVFRVLLKYHEIIEVFIPEISRIIDFDRQGMHSHSLWENTAGSVEKAPINHVIRLTMLIHDISEPECFSTDKKQEDNFENHQLLGAQTAERILKRLKYDNKTIKSVTTLIKYHHIKLKTRQDIKKLLSKTGPEMFRLLMDVQKIDMLSENSGDSSYTNDISWAEKTAEDILNKHECLSIKELDINGNQLMNEGYTGAAIGKLLNSMLEEVLEDRLENSYDSLIEYAEKSKNH